MIKSESIKELAGALSKFTGEVTNPKNTAKNPQFNSKYAPLEEILNVVRPLLSKQGLSVLQSTTGELESVTISTMLLHESGEFLETENFVLKGEQTARGGAKVLNVQGAGSMITYIRRYQISALLGLASEDDDGNHASKKDDKAPVKPQNNTPQPKAPTLEELKNEVIAVCKILADADKKEATLAAIKEISGNQNPLNLKDIKTTKKVLDALYKLK